MEPHEGQPQLARKGDGTVVDEHLGRIRTADDLEQIAQHARSGKLRLPVARTVPLSEAIPALIDLEQNTLGKRGKLIIIPD